MSDKASILDRETPVPERPLLTIDPEGMSPAQLAGRECVNCGKRWPRPRVLVGRFPAGGDARCCPECVPVVAG